MWKYTLNTKINPAEFGPFVDRQWFKAKGEKYKLAYKAPRRITRGPQSTDRDMESKARVYAEWLAQRDSITLPAGLHGVTCHWSGVNATRSNGRPYWDRRIRSVTFHGHGKASVEIALPHWDFVAIPPQTETAIAA